MARPSTAAALLLLALSLLAAAHGRPIEAEAAGSNAVVVAVSDENGAAENPTTLPADADASATKLTVVQLAEEEQEQAEQHGGFLRLPSQLHRRPCLHGLRHRHHGWVRHQIFSGDADAPRRFRSRHGEERLAAVLPAEEEVKAVAEPDPDRSLPDSDGSEGELATSTVPSFGDADGARDDADEGAAAVRAWKKEMLRRWVHFDSQSHHGMRHHRLHHHGEHAAEDEVAVAGEGEKRFHHRRHHGDDEEEDEEKEKTMRKRFRPAAEQKHDDEDSDDDEEVEEMVRRFRNAVMRRTRFGHGRRFHRHHGHHRHGEEAEKAGGGEESGVVTWIKGLMNWF